MRIEVCKIRVTQSSGHKNVITETILKLSRIAASLTLACAALAAPFAAQAADKFPERPVTILAGFPPGTSTDAIARILGEKLSAEWGQPIIVENKPGVGGSLAVSQPSVRRPFGLMEWPAMLRYLDRRNPGYDE